MNQIFLLSPADCGGKRASFLMKSEAGFPLAERMRDGGGAPIGDVFAFVSGLYFRGKLAYGERFARPPAGMAGVLVITTNRGLVPADETIGVSDLRKFGAVDIDPSEDRFRRPLARDARRIAEASGEDCRVVLLGSVATGKYVEILQPAFSGRLLFPGEFIGRGDMSRGGLLLRCVDHGQELDYIPVEGAIRRGPRPPKLEPLKAHRAKLAGAKR